MSRENAGRDFRADFLLLTETMGAACLARYGFSFEWILDGGGCRITGEWLALKEDRIAQNSGRLMLRGEGEALCRARNDERCGTGISAGDDGLVIRRLLQQDGLYCRELLSGQGSFRVSEVRHRDAAWMFSSAVPIKPDSNAFELNQPGSIPRALCELREKYPGRYAMLTGAFRALFQNIECIDTGSPMSWSFCGIRAASALPFTMKNRVCPVCVSDVSLSQQPDVSILSDGAGRVLLMLTAAVFADAEGYQLPGIEEPEIPFTRGLCRASSLRFRACREQQDPDGSQLAVYCRTRESGGSLDRKAGEQRACGVLRDKRLKGQGAPLGVQAERRVTGRIHF